MNLRAILTRTVPFLALLWVGTGCSSDNVRSELYVSEINDGEALNSDVVSSSGTIFEDEVAVTIFSQARDNIVDLSAGYGYVTIERYEVRYESEEEIEGYGGGLGWVVPVGLSYQGFVTVVPAIRKTEAPLSALVTGGEILATARITFYGREADSDNEIVFRTAVPVHFANWSD